MSGILDDVPPRTVLSECNERTGDVWIQDFDRGVIETLGGCVRPKGDMYLVEVDGVDPPPEETPGGPYTGVPVYFAFPDETIDVKIFPSFIVRRDEITPAMSRLHMGNMQYRVPAIGASTVTVTHPVTGQVIASGPDEIETKDQAVPYDFLYTIQIRARYRNNLRVAGLKMLRHVMKTYQPYTTVYVRDSLDSVRSYTAFMETPSAMDMRPDVAGRETNFNVTLRVEGELDLNDPFLRRTLTELPTTNVTTF